jgi:hypothetical protein
MATPRARSLATWLGLMPLAALVAVTAWQPWLGFGLIIGVVGGALTLVALMRTLEWLDDRDRLPAAPLAVGAVVVSVAIVAVPAVLALLLLGRSSAIAAGGVSAVLVAGFFGRIELARQLDRRRMRQLDRALVAGGDLTAALAPLPPHYLFAVVTRLADHGRWAELLAYLAGNPGRPFQARYVVDWQLAAHLALGDVAAAAAVVAAAPPPDDAAERALAELQETRLAIARGDAAAVLPTLAAPADPDLAADLVSARAAIHVDALVATGDEAGARAALAALRTRYGRAYVAQLGKRARPCSALARAVADDDA